ncbi:hypothetical protein BDD43_3447 [Mucilaginibacter gracilis]|uniref:Uncharacterized protein n=1 Tax=Mucilaginibacter gracilis TaxID=423350 RepID=A0A495J335_9SPHI|nr:hypothetical protein [Mucilaginibacter gracilis]RKR83243.1 hypothetical protein BDD43_3447 [Mucilaginibacter gracilis]
MIKKGIIIACILLLCSVCYGQMHVIPAKGIVLPKDSTALINAIEGFLSRAKPNKDNPYILKENLIETSALLDEMKGMQNAGATKPDFYKCYLSNVSALDSNGYIIQLSYLGGDGQAPVLRAVFKILALKKDGQYYLSSPLKRNTLTWNKQKTGNFTVYRNTTDKVQLLDKYIKTAMEFDKKLHANNYITQIYYCYNFTDAMALLGEDYKLDYNSLANDNNSWFEPGDNLQIIGANKDDKVAFDLHDLWHNRLHHVVSTDIINRPIDEGCAYLYGGSWGVYTWQTVFETFKTYMGTDHDWLKAFTDHRRFGGAKTPLYTDYVINALIAQKIEKEKGFAQVIAFLSCGKKQPDNANYFTALEKITGITKTTFNAEIEKLVMEK